MNKSTALRVLTLPSALPRGHRRRRRRWREELLHPPMGELPDEVGRNPGGEHHLPLVLAAESQLLFMAGLPPEAPHDALRVHLDVRAGAAPQSEGVIAAAAQSKEASISALRRQPKG